MTLTRLLAAALLLCSIRAFAQGQPKPGYLLSKVYRFGPCFSPSATPEKPWRIISNPPAEVGSEQDPRFQFALERPSVECRSYTSLKRKAGAIPGNLYSCSQLQDADATCHMVRFYFMDMLPNGQPAYEDMPVNESDMVGPTCYTIRGYVVARDSKDSDSTHPVGYSTCQPSNRYRVRSADIRVDSGNQ